MKRVVLYARVSTINHGQTVENQLLVLREVDRKSTRLNSSHSQQSRMPSSA